MSQGFLQKRLEEREGHGLLRRLPPENSGVDFSSNDYLGFSRSAELREMLDKELKRAGLQTGSTGSRLLTGNSVYAEELERFIADFHKSPSALLFNSGYDANVGLLSSVCRKEDTVFYDELSHASIYDGVRLSKAESFPFRHNDTVHLEERLKFFRSGKGKTANCFVVVESVYSMDGDFSPLKEISFLCEEHGANLIVDEAHATGIFGPRGEGRVVELGLEKKVFARVHTFGKALGCHGAAVLGSEALRDYLVNFARSFIYTTALPKHSLAAIKSAYSLLNIDNNILIINKLIKLFKLKFEALGFADVLTGDSPIQSVIIEGNEEVKHISQLIRKDGFDVRPILSPTVPKGRERIRICLHAFNTEGEVDGLIASLKSRILPAHKKQIAAL